MTITPDDAFGLALIAKRPDLNKDLIQSLSPHVQEVGEAFYKKSNNPKINETVNALNMWAHETKLYE